MIEEQIYERDPFGPGGYFGLKVSDLKLALQLAVNAASGIDPGTPFVERIRFALRGFDAGHTCVLLKE